MKRIVVALAVLLVLPVYRAGIADEMKPAANATGEYTLGEFGDVSKTANLQELVNKACAAIIARGGGTLIIPPTVPPDIAIENLSQSERVAGTSKPSVTIVDRRNGYTRTLTPPIGRWSTSGWNGQTVRRTMNVDGPGINSWGNFNAFEIENRIVHGSSSYLHPTPFDAKQGKDSPVYVYTVRGIFVGGYLNYYLGPGYANGYEPTVVKSVGWDAERKMHYFTADLTKDHAASAYLSNKNHVGGFNIDSSVNTDQQTAGEFAVFRKQYANGDSFLINGTYVYQGDVITQLGDEGGVIFNAEPESDFEIFHSKVESVDWSRDALVFEPGTSNVEKLASSRSLINMNEKKWITTGTVKIVGQDDWGGALIQDPKYDVANAVKNGIDLKTFKFVREPKQGEDFAAKDWRGVGQFSELYQGKKQIPAIITWNGHPIKSFKYTYQGRAYPSLHFQGKNMLGGRIIASADCGWTKDIIGRYFAVDDDGECLLPNDTTMGGTPAAGYNPTRRVRRWYPISDFWKNADDTCGIRLGRVRMFAAGAGAPNLYNDDNYTWDGHERPLKYIIAPGSMVYDVGAGYKDAYGGLTTKADPRTIKIVPCSDRGTRFDFESGDAIEEAIGPDPVHPIPIRVRLWNEVPNNFGDYGGVIELSNNGRVSTGCALLFASGVSAVEELPMRKDRKPPFVTGIDMQSLVQNGMRFGADTLNSALLFEQPHDRAQPIKWQHANGTTALTVDPRSGDMAISGSKLVVPGVKGTSGISATRVAANNLRGMDIAVSKGAREFAVRFATPEADSHYSLNVQPSWFTQDAVVHKTATGFTVRFSAPAPAGATFDWQLIR